MNFFNASMYRLVKGKEAGCLKLEEVMGGLKKLHNKESDDLQSLPNIRLIT